MSPELKKLPVLLLLVIYFIAVFCRLEWGERFRNEEFTSESALRLYYAEQVSIGRDLPIVDQKAQYPEGLKLFSRNPVVMEYITGYLYSLLAPPIPFVDFIRLIIPVIASLSVFAVYFTVREITRETIGALIATLFFALALPAIPRASGYEFLHETIALPAIFFQVYFFLKTIKSGKLQYAILAGICISLALSSWKISQLYFLLFAVFTGIMFLTGRCRAHFNRAVMITVIFAIITGLAVRFLREGLFLTSFAMLIFYSLIVSFLWRKFNTSLKVDSRYIFSFCLLLFIFLLPQSSRNAHVYELMVYKILYLGHKPSQPLSLPFDVRALWVDPFITPSIFELIYFFVPLLLIGVGALLVVCRGIIGRRCDVAKIFICYNTIVFLVAYLMIRRLRGFFIYFLILLIGYLLSWILRRSGRLRWPGIAIIILALILEGGKTIGFSSTLIYQPGLKFMGIKEQENYFQAHTLRRSRRELINWLKNHTGEDDVILAHYQISPMIRAYADRAVNLTSLFESSELREKVKEYVTALFGSENDLYLLCEKFQTDYVVCSIDTILDVSNNSWRYLAAHSDPVERTIAFRMHFLPEQLNNFSLLYENEYYRVYRVTETDQICPMTEKLSSHPLFFRSDLFYRNMGSPRRFKKYVESVYQVYLSGSRALSAGQYRTSRRAYDIALLMAPDFPEPYAGLGAIAEEEGRSEDALIHYREYLRLKPEGEFAGEIKRRIDTILRK